MKARPINIVDGHDPKSGHRFGAFAASVTAGGKIADDECQPVRASKLYVVRRFAMLFWVDARDVKEGVGEWIVGFFLSRRRAQHIADELTRAHARGIMDVFR